MPGESKTTNRLDYVGIGIIVGLFSLLFYFYLPSLFDQIDLRLKDVRFLLRGKAVPDARVAILAIDNQSIKAFGRWPWSRELVGRVITKLSAQGARVIALDIVFSEPQNSAADKALADALGEAGNVVLGHFFRHEKQAIDPSVSRRLHASRIENLNLPLLLPELPLTEYPAVDANISGIVQGGIDMGFFNQLADGDGLFRRSLLLVLHEGAIYPSLALAGLKQYRGEDLSLALSAAGVAQLKVGERVVPSRHDGTLSLSWYGPTGTVPTLSVSELMTDRIPASALKDKLVFVGFTEKAIYDVRATPFDPALPGVEIHATAASNMLQERFIRSDGMARFWTIMFILFLPPLLALFLSQVRSTWSGLVVYTALTAGFLCGNYFLFAVNLWDIAIAYPLMGLLLSYFAGEAYRNLVVERQGRYLQKAFASYVSPELVEELVKHPEQLALGGEKREISVLFSDIRGFTSLSESLSPELLVRLLNRYLTPMTQIVMSEKGTLDKYIGDAIMAIYNAPLDIADHPAHACRSALLMLDALNELNGSYAAEGLPTITIGIGIHTGEAVVGNMGAANRFDYTAIGDTVNLASRLEGMTKQYGVKAVVSETTAQLAGPAFFYRELDLVLVKGKHTPIAIFELLPAPYPHAERFQQAIALYRKKEFIGAATLFSEIPTDSVVDLYRKRSEAFSEVPPPEEWDGVFTATEK